MDTVITKFIIKSYIAVGAQPITGLVTMEIDISLHYSHTQSKIVYVLTIPSWLLGNMLKITIMNFEK